MQPCTILHVLGTAQVEGTSIVAVPAMLARLLDPGRFRIHACFLEEDGPLVQNLEAGGVVVSRARWLRSSDLVGTMRFARAVRHHGPDVIHQHFGGRAVRWVARRASGVPLIMHLHGRVRETEPDKLIPMHLADVAAVIANSSATAACVRGIEPQVIYPAVPLPERTADVWCDSELIVGTASRLVPLKGIRYLVRAVARLSARFPKLRLEVAGSGPDEVTLRDLAAQLGVADRVRFLGWCDDLATVMRGWQIYVQPSIEEALGAGILHAMAAGLPVIATRVGGIPEAVADGMSGFLVAPSDADALADKLAFLIQSPELRRQMGSAGRKLIIEHFSEAGAAARIMSLYDQVLATSTSPRARSAHARL